MTDEEPEADRKTNEAQRSIRYLAEAALTYGKVGSLAELLDRVAAFDQYKPYNALLVLLQRPAATYVLPAHAWEERYGRVIRPDQQPLVMLQPGGPVMFLFDVSQTEEGPGAQSLPLGLCNPYRMRPSPNAARALDWVTENAKADGVRVLDAEFGLPFAGCIQRTEAHTTQPVTLTLRPPTRAEVAVRYDVLLNRAYSRTEQLATLAHELGHLYCGHLGTEPNPLWPQEKFWPDRRRLTLGHRELEAESVARVVFRRLAPDNPLPPHLDQYFGTDPDLSGVDLEPILTAAGRILEMCEGHAPRRPRRKGRSLAPPSERR